MITVYVLEKGCLRPADISQSGALPEEAIWIDLLNPTREEKGTIERLIAIDAPTLEDMQEIEPSSRIYQEGEARFMTATVAAKAETETPISAAITFIRTGRILVTLRYEDPKPFQTFASRAIRHPGLAITADMALIGLLDAIIDRSADLIEKTVSELDAMSREIFSSRVGASSQRTDFEGVVRKLGRTDDVVSKVKDSMSSVLRVVTYLTQAAGEEKGNKQYKLRLKSLSRDALSLNEHASFIAHKINFLLDATLGLINIQQTAIIKIFSVAAVVFLPPTLIASIYGMNFKILPELNWDFGYLWALALMVVSAILPYWYFKRRGWL